MRIAAAIAMGFAVLLEVAGMPTPGLAAAIPGRMIVKYRAGIAAAKRVQLTTTLGAHRVRVLQIINAEVLEVQGDAATAIARAAADPAVEYAEPDFEVSASVIPDDPLFPQLWALHNTGQYDGTPGADIRAPEAWDLFTGDPELRIGIIDTGIDPNHPDLRQNVWTNPGEIPGNLRDDDGNGYVDDVHGYDFYSDDGDPFDDYGHGAHIAGTIGASANDGIGVAGICWHCKLVGIKFLNSAGRGATSGAIAGLEYAVRVGCKVTNHSYGGADFSQAWLDAIEAAGRAGCLIVAAAGNNAQDVDNNPFYPAGFDSPYIIAVGASEQNDFLAEFSNYGATSVDLAAPGEAILSVRSGGGWIHLAGTSMAAPHVTGVAALVAGRFPEFGPLLIKNRILAAVDSLPWLAGLCASGGRLNAFRSLARLDSVAPSGVGDLVAGDPGSTTLVLSWTAGGDDGPVGTAFEYDIRRLEEPIDAGNFERAVRLEGPPPLLAGSPQDFHVTGLRASTRYWFAMRTVDDYANTSPISNVTSSTTLAAPLPGTSPARYDVRLFTGAKESQPLVLRNDGPGTLDFTVLPAKILLPVVPFAAKTSEPPLHLAKGDDDPRRGPAVITGEGGPDAYGYRWIDSDDPDGPASTWDSGATSQLDISGDEQVSQQVGLEFAFPFYGNVFRSCLVSTNGTISFTDRLNPWANQPLPNTAAAANLIAPFWDDLDLRGERNVRVRSTPNSVLITWTNVYRYRYGGPFSFQVQLFRNGEINFRYRDMGPIANSATIGIQNSNKTIGMMVGFNTEYARNGLTLRILPLRTWAEINPSSSGRLHGGESSTLDARFDASNMAPGDYQADLRIATNAAAEPVEIPVFLHVDSAPVLDALPVALAYGTIFVGSTSTRSLRITNNGTNDLEVTGIDVPAPLHPDVTSFVVPPRTYHDVEVSLTPEVAAVFSGDLHIHSNDPLHSTVTVPYLATAILPPSFTVDADSFDVQLYANTTVTRTLRLANHGGSVFTYSAEAIWAAAEATAVQPVRVALPASTLVPLTPKGAADHWHGPIPARSGGPDHFGYRFVDSDEAGGPGFEWIEVRNSGTRVPFGADDENLGPFPIGFAFPFYGLTFNAFHVCSNGFLSFTSALASYANSTLPSRDPTSPPNLLAPLWDDWDLRAGGSVWFRDDGTRLIVQFQDVVRFGTDEIDRHTSFEVVLYPDGRVVFQYLGIGALDRQSSTIGIQNAARDDGLQVAIDTDYVHDRLAVRFVPPARFLTITPASGNIPPDGFVDLALRFDAATLRSGTYAATLRIAGNDPALAQLDLPTALTVIGAPDLVPDSTRIDFGNVNLGYPRVRQLIVRNLGSEPLHVSQISSTDTAFTTNATEFTVPALGRSLLSVGFAPSEARQYDAVLQIKSDDPDRPITPVDVTGNALEAPRLFVEGGSLLVARLERGTTATRRLVLHDTGGSNLLYDIAVQANGVPRLAPADVGFPARLYSKQDVDPRRGILGEGGPDGFGNRWRDSDAAGGPIFDWVDPSGSRLALTRDDQTAAAVPIGFDFPFYGRTYRSMSVCTNGWLSFSSTDSTYSNQPLPSNGARVPRALVAALWDDLRPVLGSEIRLRSDADRCVVSWSGLTHFLTGASTTFQVILYRDGRIRLQYLDAPDSPGSATLGLQDADGSMGLLIAYNTAYVHDRLAVEIRPGGDWVTTTTTTGSIEPGGEAPIDIGFSAGDLALGQYEGHVRITSNDPDVGRLDLPVTLIVSEPTSTDNVLPLRDTVLLAGGNPARSSARFEVALVAAGTAEISLYDVRGTRVQRLGLGPRAPGWHPVTWDGRDAAGRQVASGVYFARLRTTRSVTTLRFALLR